MHRNQRTLIAISGAFSDRKVVEYAARFAELGFARHYHLVHVRTASQAVDMARQKNELMEYMEELPNNHFKCDRAATSASCHVLDSVASGCFGSQAFWVDVESVSSPTRKPVLDKPRSKDELISLVGLRHCSALPQFRKPLLL
jgi:hypothetical protein